MCLCNIVNFEIQQKCKINKKNASRKPPPMLFGISAVGENFGSRISFAPIVGISVVGERRLTPWLWRVESLHGSGDRGSQIISCDIRRNRLQQHVRKICQIESVRQIVDQIWPNVAKCCPKFCFFSANVRRICQKFFMFDKFDRWFHILDIRSKLCV